jgi:hypothetical protein
LILIMAMACADIEPYICLPPIEVAPPPAVAGVDSWWEYDVVYDPGSTETTVQTATLVARGLGDPIPSPATACLTPPSGQGPYYQLSWNDVSTCTCQATGGCLYDGTDSPFRSMSGGAMSMIMMGMDVYAREANLVDMYSLAPACAAMTVPAPMSNLALVAEISSDGYTAVSGSVGYPYSVGDKWTYTSALDSFVLGMCASLIPPGMPPTINTAEVIAVGVTNPDGGFADCVQIDTVSQVDNDVDGLYGEDPVNGNDDDGDTLVDEDPVETCVTTTWWSPTALAMVETHNPCSYDLQENKVLINYSLVP